MSSEDAAMLAVATIQNSNEDPNNIEYVKMSQIKSDTKEFEFIDNTQIKKFAEGAKTKFPLTKK